MLRVDIRRVKPEKEARLREWLLELNTRADEVRATFVGETVRAEQAYIIPTSDGPVLVYAMEAESFDVAAQAYASSKHPIDHEHRAVMQECLGEPLEVKPLYDVAATDSHRSASCPDQPEQLGERGSKSDEGATHPEGVS